MHDSFNVGRQTSAMPDPTAIAQALGWNARLAAWGRQAAQAVITNFLNGWKFHTYFLRYD